MREITLNRQKLGLEDLLFGVGIVTQIRAGQKVDVTRINAGNLPFDETRTLLEWTQSINLDALSSMTTELQAIYDNLTTIGNVEDNLTVINNLEDNLVALQSLYTNISKLQNIDNNMSKLQNIDTNMSKLQNIDTNMSKLQAIYTDLTKLESIYDNLTMLTAIYNNLTALNNINSQVIPNLTELLLVNDNAIQVAADKLTVATDKGIVAGYKEDVSAMKVAVESIYDTFDDRFLGVKTNDPIVDNDGDTLNDGALYFNTSSNNLKVYSLDNTTWYTISQIYLSGLLDVQLTSITTGDILNWNGTKWVNTRTPKFSTMQLTGGTGTEGTLSWNTDEGTVDIILPNGSILQVGQEGIRKVRNSTASTITNGTVVMSDGTIGNSGRIKVKPFTGGFNEALYVYGIATQDILAGADGIITTEGKIRDINTTGSLVGETWADEDILYAKPGDSGALTKVVPSDSQLKMVMASVIHAHTSGTLEIRFTPINENTWYTKVQSDALADIHNKTAKTTPVDADEFMTADSTSTWSLKKITWANIKTALASLFIPRVTSTDNAVVRFNGTTGDVQNSAITIDDNGNIGTGTQTFNGFGGAGFKNYIINGGFNVNQYPPFSATDGYKIDRWLVSGTSSVNNVSQGQLNGEAESDKGLVISKNSTSATAYIIQKIEFPRRLAGKKATVSFKCYSPTAFNGVVYLDKYNPTDGLSNAVGEQTFSWSNSWNKYELTFTFPTLGANYNHKDSSFQLVFAIPKEVTTTGAWLTDVQLELGSVATPFEQRPIGLELSLCQRYFRSLGLNTSWYAIGACGVNTGTVVDTTYALPIPMRRNPDLSVVGAYSNYSITDGVGAYTPTSIAIQDSAPDCIAIRSLYSGGTAGRSAKLMTNTTNGGILLNAEL